ncbi:MAG: hemolysin III family protein [Pseudomonadota bacterium]
MRLPKRATASTGESAAEDRGAPLREGAILAARRTYSPAERAADAVIHVIGVFGSLIAVSVLITIAAFTQDGWTVATLAIYGVCAFTVFVASAAYHMLEWPAGRWLLRRFDHAAIFLKIAATYTPFAAISLGGASGASLLAVVWAIAAVGAPLKLFAPDRLERFSLWLYLAQGWLVVFAIGPLAASLSPEATWMLVIGGVLYTLGVPFFLWERLPFHNAIWHGCVLAASACMYAAVMNGVALAPSEASAEPALATPAAGPPQEAPPQEAPSSGPR